MFVISSTGRRFASGRRWHSRHQLIVSGVAFSMAAISSTLPWQLMQPTPLFTWIE